MHLSSLWYLNLFIDKVSAYFRKLKTCIPYLFNGSDTWMVFISKYWFENRMKNIFYLKVSITQYWYFKIFNSIRKNDFESFILLLSSICYFLLMLFFELILIFRIKMLLDLVVYERGEVTALFWLAKFYLKVCGV